MAEKYDAAAHQTIASRVSTRELGFDLGRIPFEVRHLDAASILNKPQSNNRCRDAEVHARFVRERVELGEVAIGEGRIYCLPAHRMRKEFSIQKEMQSHETASYEMLRVTL
jgi:hypothetical protein